jgi:hypothetical protein
LVSKPFFFADFFVAFSVDFQAASVRGLSELGVSPPVRLSVQFVSGILGFQDLGISAGTCGHRQTDRTTVSVNPRLSRVESRQRPRYLVPLAFLILLLGMLPYLTDRVAGQAMLWPSAFTLKTGNLFGPVGAWLPSFAHAFAFSLLTVAVLAPSARPRWGVCAMWAVIDVAFELGQRREIAGHLAKFLLNDIGAVPLTRPLARYFVHGTFDPLDMLAAVVGAIAAAVVLHGLATTPEKADDKCTEAHV